MIKQKRSDGLIFHFQPPARVARITGLGFGMGQRMALGGVLLGGMGVLVGLCVGSGKATQHTIGTVLACVNSQYHKLFWAVNGWVDRAWWPGKWTTRAGYVVWMG